MDDTCEQSVLDWGGKTSQNLISETKLAHRGGGFVRHSAVGLSESHCAVRASMQVCVRGVETEVQRQMERQRYRGRWRDRGTEAAADVIWLQNQLSGTLAGTFASDALQAFEVLRTSLALLCLCTIANGGPRGRP